MGKRKAKLLQPKKPKLLKLDKEFECPFCSHLRSVLVKMDRGRGVASLSCRICGASFDKRINRLDEAVDVYGAWIDACVAANTQAAEQAKKRMASLIGGGGGSTPGAPGERSDSSVSGTGGAGGETARVATRTGQPGEKEGAAAAEENVGAVGGLTRNGVKIAADGNSSQSPPRSAADASSWGAKDTDPPAAAGTFKEAESVPSADGISGRGASSTTGSKRLAGAGGSGNVAGFAPGAAPGGGSRLRRLRLERRQEDYSSSEEDDEVDESFEFTAIERDDEQQRGKEKSTGKEEHGDSGALDVLTRLREQQREEEENDAEAGAGDLFRDDE